MSIPRVRTVCACLFTSAYVVILFALTGGDAMAGGSSDRFTGDFASVLIKDIRFEGNEVTRRQIMLQELKIHAGDTVTPGQIEEARQSIMDLGLFKRVRARLDDEGGAKVLVFQVEEKYYVLPVPLVSGDPNKRNYSYGLEVRVDNLGGLNQHLRLKYERDQSGEKDLPERKKGSVDYSYPRVMGSPYNLSLGYSFSEDSFNAVDPVDNRILASYKRNVTSINSDLSRWLTPEGPSRGWSGGVGLAFTGEEYNLLAGQPGLHENGQAVGLNAHVSMTAIHDRVYYFEGKAYGWNGEVGSKLLGSSYDYTRNYFYYRSYNHFGELRNLNWQMRLGLADSEIFVSPPYSLGGYSTLRGYEKALTGKAYLLSNLEYHQQVDGYPALRGLVFLDVGNAYPSVSSIDPTRLETGTGVGFLWRIQQLVNVTLAFNAAYGIGPHKTVYYFMTTGTF